MTVRMFPKWVSGSSRNTQFSKIDYISSDPNEYHVNIYNLSVLASFLNAITQIEPTVAEIYNNILCAVKPYLKEQFPFVPGWIKSGDFQHIILTRKDCEKALVYTSMQPVNIKKVSLLKYKDDSIGLTINIKKQTVDAFKMVLKPYYSPKDYICNNEFPFFFMSIEHFDHLENIFAAIQPIDSAIDYIKDDLLHTYDPHYHARQKMAFLMGLHQKVGRDSTISILRKNKIGEVKLVNSIFSFLHPVTGKESKTITEPSQTALIPYSSPALDSKNEANEKTYTGIVKWFNNSKGFGYIKSDEGRSIFVHFKNIGSRPDDVSYRFLSEDDRVQFTLGKRKVGDKIFPCAENVFVINAPQEKEYRQNLKSPGG